MKLNPINNLNIKGVSLGNSQTFTSNPVINRGDVSVDKLPEVTKDYNVSTPQSYSYIGEIKLPQDLVAKCYKLANGQKVVIVPKTSGTTVVKTYVNTGSMNEPDRFRGISHYIEHNLFNGSEELGDKMFFDEVYKMGAETNASTSFSITDYYISSSLLDDQDLETSIKLHGAMLSAPKFLQDKLDKEKKVVDSEINMYAAYDDITAFNHTLKNLLNIKSTSPDLVAGTTNNIDALTRQDVVDYYNNNYYPANMVTVVTGEVEPEQTIKYVAKYFTSKKTPVKERNYEVFTPIQKTVREDIISKNSKETARISIGFVGPENNNTKDKIYAHATAILLTGLHNSRLSDIEKKYTAGVGISPERLGTRPTDINVIGVESAVSEKYVEPMLKDIYSVLNSIAQNPPTQQEMDAIKNSLKTSFDKRFECSHALNQLIGQSLLNEIPEYITDYKKIVDEMTAQDIVNFAKKYYDLNKAAITVVHSKTSTPESISNNYTKAQNNISFTGALKKTPIDMNKVEQYIAHNNFEIILNDIQSDNINYEFSIRTKNNTAKNVAQADVLSDMLITGGTKYQDYKTLQAQKDTLGLEATVIGGEKGIVCSASFPVENTDKSLSIIREKIQNPEFSQEIFNQAVRRCKDDYEMAEPSAKENISTVLYKGTPLEYTTLQKAQSLDSVTLDGIKELYGELLTKGHGKLVISAPFSKHPELKEKIFNDINQYQTTAPKDIKLNEVYTPIEKTEVLTAVKNKNQAHIIEGFKFKYSQNLRDDTALKLMNIILGGSTNSRLFTDLREKEHLAYSVRSNYSHYEDIGVVNMSIETTTLDSGTGQKSYENIQRSIDGFNRNIRKLKTEFVTPDELESAKRVLKTALLDSMEMNVGKTAALAGSSSNPYGLNVINQRFDIIDSITPKDIYNAANYVFSTKPVYSLTGTQESIDANKEYFKKISD